MSPELVYNIEKYENIDNFDIEKSNIFSLGLIFLRLILLLNEK